MLELIVHQTNSTVTTTMSQQAWNGISADSTVWAAAVSAVVAFLILAIDRLWIEPRKWRSRYQVKSLEAAIEIHEWLVSVLKACREKAERTPQRPDKPPHLLESDDIRKLEDILEKKAYLLSKKLKQTWYEAHRKDKTFLLDGVKHRDRDFRVLSIDLAEMQKQAETDLSELQSRYEKMTKLSLFK